MKLRAVLVAIGIATATIALAQPVIMNREQPRGVQARTDVSVSNPTTLQLQLRIDALRDKVDELSGQIAAQQQTLAQISGSLAQQRAANEQFRTTSENHYRTLRRTTLVTCMYIKSNVPPWNVGDDQTGNTLSKRYCEAETMPAEFVTY